MEAQKDVIDVAYNAYNTRMVTLSDGDCISISEKGSADGPLWKEPTAAWRSPIGPLLKVGISLSNFAVFLYKAKADDLVFESSGSQKIAIC